MRAGLFICYFFNTFLLAESFNYELKQYIKIPLNITHIKLDIGLWTEAPNSQEWLKKEEGLCVFGFEPCPEALGILKKGRLFRGENSYAVPLRFDSKLPLKKNRFILMPFALGNVEVNKYLDFYVGNDIGVSSFYKPIDISKFPIKSVIKVPVISLKYFFDLFPWDRFKYIDYIKVDAQGADLDILKGAGSYLSDRVVYVTAEPDGCHYEGANICDVDNISTYMASQGFIPIKHPNTNDPTFINKKYMYLKDDIFIFQR